MDVTPWIDRLVAQLKELGCLRSPEVERAFRRVPRHLFLEGFYRASGQTGPSVLIQHNPRDPRPEHLDLIYSNEALPIHVAEGKATSSTSQPSLMAQMLEFLDLSPGMKVLEIGAGTGYNAALMAELVGDPTLVVSVDIQEEVVARTRRLLTDARYSHVKLLVRDGFYGVQEDGPFDRIVATVGCTDLSPHWVMQLKPSGFMLLPLLHCGWHPLTRVWVEEGRVKGAVVGSSGFMPIEGELAWQGPWQARPAPVSEAEAEHFPLFEGLQGQGPLDPFRWWTSISADFFYFLALRDQRFFLSRQPLGYGLYEPSLGIVLVNPLEGRILLQGARELYHQLENFYLEWLHLGKPQMSDYRFEFFPLSELEPPLPAGAWSIQRKFYRQVVTLSKD
jgi:protein-L-isoaspartate(D-aspartate) O-methyltransferase